MISIDLVKKLPEHDEWKEDFVTLWNKMDDEKRSIYLSLERAKGVPPKLEKFYLEFVNEGSIIEYPYIKPNEDWAFASFKDDLKLFGIKHDFFDLIVGAIDSTKLFKAYVKFFCDTYRDWAGSYERLHYDPEENRIIAVKRNKRK